MSVSTLKAQFIDMILMDVQPSVLPHPNETQFDEAETPHSPATRLELKSHDANSTRRQRLAQSDELFDVLKGRGSCPRRKDHQER
jgi:hypothetical protein